MVEHVLIMELVKQFVFVLMDLLEHDVNYVLLILVQIMENVLFKMEFHLVIVLELVMKVIFVRYKKIVDQKNV